MLLLKVHIAAHCGQQLVVRFIVLSACLACEQSSREDTARLNLKCLEASH